MEQIEVISSSSSSSYLSNSWNYINHLPLFFLSSSNEFTTITNNHNNNTSSQYQGLSKWLSCNTQEDGWGPLSSTYNDLTPCFTRYFIWYFSNFNDISWDLSNYLS